MATVQADRLSVHQFTWGGLASRWMPYCLLAGVGIALALGLLVLGIARPDGGTFLPGLIFAAAGLGCAVPLGIAYQRRVHKAEVYSDRLVWWDDAGEHQMRWEDVASVHRFEKITAPAGSKPGSGWYQTALTITGRQGKVIFDHSLSDFAGLADHAQQLSAPHLLTQKEAECRQGSANFGPLTLRADGISLGSTSRRWNEFEYAVSGGYLVIVPAGDHFGWEDRVEIALVDIPNPQVLLELMVRLGKPPTDPSRVIPLPERARMSQLRR